jgi:hypothetical protein
VRNVLAAGECPVSTPSEDVPIVNPRLLYEDEGLELMPAPLRQILGLLGERDFLALDH